MQMNKLKNVIEYMTNHGKVVFPIAVIAAVAVTVSVALNLGKDGKLEEEGLGVGSTEATETTEPLTEEEQLMVLNEDPNITNLINTYYSGAAAGDADVLNSVCKEIPMQEMLGYQEKAKYIEQYTPYEIYTKPGLEADSKVVFVYSKVVLSGHPEELPGYSALYVCTNEEGELYIKSNGFTAEQDAFLGQVFSQDDVIEFNNRVNVEYNALMQEHPELLEYLTEMSIAVQAAIGEGLAEQNATEAQEQVSENDADLAGGDAGAEAGQEPEENAVQYATATTTVNVRSSDSEKADKLGKVSGGEQLQVLEQRPNGWTKVLYAGKEGYIKTEFLQMAESADGMESIGTVTATTNINVRASASETADRLGVLAGGESVELLAKEDGWCKIKYNGQVGYVKADYVE